MAAGKGAAKCAAAGWLKKTTYRQKCQGRGVYAKKAIYAASIIKERAR